MPNVYGPIDYTAADCAVLEIPTSLRPAGDIKYRLRGGSYREDYSHDTGAFQQITAFVDWQDANDFINFSLGWSEWDGTDSTRLTRILPMKSPYQSTMHCDKISLANYTVRQGTNIRASSEANINYWPEADDAEYTLTFRPRLYDMLTDAEIDSSDYPWAAYGCKELGRYVLRVERVMGEELKLGTYGLEIQDPDWAPPDPAEKQYRGIAEPGFVPFNKTEVVYNWFQVPQNAIPLQAIANCLGRVNDAAFDKIQHPTTGAWSDRFAAGTLLFKGLGGPLEPHSGPDGERLVDIQYVFSYLPNTWNKFPPPDPTSSSWWPVWRRGTSPRAPLYGSADFRNLFKPRAL